MEVNEHNNAGNGLQNNKDPIACSCWGPIFKETECATERKTSDSV